MRKQNLPPCPKYRWTFSFWKSLQQIEAVMAKCNKLPHHIFIQNICSKYSFKIFDDYFGSHTKFWVAEAVMRKRNELEKLKMLRQDEERRREELVGEKMKIQKSWKSRKFKWKGERGEQPLQSRLRLQEEDWGGGKPGEELQFPPYIETNFLDFSRLF